MNTPNFCRCSLGLALVCLHTSNAGALEIKDPTQPPMTRAAPAAGTGRVTGLLRPNAPSSPALPPPRVQSLHLPEHGAASALIDGRLLHVGDRLGELTITQIDPQGVELKSTRGMERLQIVTGILKTPLPATTESDKQLALNGPKEP